MPPHMGQGASTSGAEMIGALVAFWSGLPKWLQTTFQIFGAGILLALAGKAFMDAVREEGARRQREKNERAVLEEQARVDAERRAINQENEDASQAADQAVRDLPRYRHTEQLRNSDSGVSEIVLGPDPRHGS